MIRTKYFIHIQIFLFAAVAGLVGCNSSTDYTQDVPTDVEITKFSLGAIDSVDMALDSVAFTIDQIGGQIYNVDSLPFNLNFPHKYYIELTCTSYSSIRFYTANNDTVFYTGSEDSIDFSAPVRILVKGVDSLVTKEYVAKLNIAKVDPDTLEWHQMNTDLFGQEYNAQKAFVVNNNICLFVSRGLYNYMYTTPISDGVKWSQTRLTSLPPTVDVTSMVRFSNRWWAPTFQSEVYQSEDGIEWKKNSNDEPIIFIYGLLAGVNKEPERMVAVVRTDSDVLEFAISEDGNTWQRTGIKIPADFPVDGCTAVNHEVQGVPRLTVIGGHTYQGQLTNGVFQFYMNKGVLNASTNLISSGKAFTPREGASVIAYDDTWWLIGGRTDEYEYSKEIFKTPDAGFTWSIDTGKVALPDNFAARANMSCVVDPNNFVWIIGGENRKLLRDVWRGRINRLAK